MAKTAQKLVIWIADEWHNRPEVQALRDKGHTVLSFYDNDFTEAAPDLILHPAAHAWNDKMWGYLEMALKAARKRKYPPRTRRKK